MRRRAIVVALMLGAGLAATFGGAPVQAKSYPEKPVRIIVPFSPGGPPDVISRLIAGKLSERWGHQVYVENIPGAGGNMGYVRASKSAPDGYTLAAMSPGFTINGSLYAKPAFDPLKDFTPITLLAGSPNVVAVNPSVPANSMAELIELIKQNPGKYSYGHPSSGTIPHLLGELMKIRYGLDLATVPFTGAGAAVTSAIGGHTPIVIAAAPGLVGSIKGGSLRALGVTSDRRTAALSDVPTTKESGVEGIVGETLNGIVGPAGLPPELAAKIHNDLTWVLQQPDIQQRFQELGFDRIGAGPADFTARIDQEVKKWGKVINDANIPKVGG